MARFRGTVQGGRSQASRLGYIKTGLTVECNGWNAGIRVEALADGDVDCFRVYVTGGSNGGSRETYVGELRQSGSLSTWGIPGSGHMEVE